MPSSSFEAISKPYFIIFDKWEYFFVFNCILVTNNDELFVVFY